MHNAASNAIHPLPVEDRGLLARSSLNPQKMKPLFSPHIKKVIKRDNNSYNKKRKKTNTKNAGHDNIKYAH